MKKTFKLVFFSSICLLFCSCTDYWWSRGQAPSVEKQLKKSQDKLVLAIDNFGPRRKELLGTANDLNKALLNSLVTLKNKPDNKQELSNYLETVEESFVNLEGKINVTSRAPYGELSGSLRAFVMQLNEGNSIDRHAFGLFASRIFSFLASELELPEV